MSPSKQDRAGNPWIIFVVIFAVLGLTGGYFGTFTVKPYYDVINGVKTITSLSCTLNNESSRSIELSKCDIYCDLKYFSTMEYNSRSGILASGESKKVTFDNLGGRANKFGFTIVWYYSYNGGNYEYRCEYKD